MKVLHRWIVSLAWGLFVFHLPLVQSQSLRSSGASTSTTTTTTTTTANEQNHRHLTVHDLKTNFQIAKAKFYDKLKEDYGPDIFDEFFFFQEDGQAISAGRAYHIPATGRGGVSWWRMQRKLMMKILNYMISASRQPFVWATGGHSAS